MKRKVITGLVVGLVLVIPAGPAAAHQHLANPSGTCPSEKASVPQGLANPGGQVPDGRNQANASGAQGAQNCERG